MIICTVRVWLVAVCWWSYEANGKRVHFCVLVAVCVRVVLRDGRRCSMLRAGKERAVLFGCC
jgi:hypothetical protein